MLAADELERIRFRQPVRVTIEFGPEGVSVYHEAGHTVEVELVDQAGDTTVQAIPTNALIRVADPVAG